MKIKDERFAAGKPYSSIREQYDEAYGTWFQGEYFCGDGIVKIYAENSLKSGGFATLEIRYQGSTYYRTVSRSKYFTPRSLSVLAGKFARKVYENG